jgi:Trk-type K+ transport system membrane component
MMYISAFPVAITIRSSNVYEERSLGIYADDPGYDADKMGIMGSLQRALNLQLGRQSATKGYFIQQQLRAQLSHDLWWLALAVWLIAIIENSQFVANPAVFSVFNIIFEVVSGMSATVNIHLTNYKLFEIINQSQHTGPSESLSAYHGQLTLSVEPGTA